MRRRTWWWFLLPLVTFGFATSPMVLVGGVKLRNRKHSAAALAYLALTLFFFVAVQFTPENGGTLSDAIVMPAFAIPWFAGTIHVLYLQLKVAELGRPPFAAPPPRPAPPTDPAIAAAQWRLDRRREARAILGGNPPLAAELRIGRPDLQRQYDDGGLVDVNHVPAPVLATELDLSPQVAAAITTERERLGGFGSAEEIMVYCEGLTPDRLELIRDRLIFVPL
ncbi:ComEA family DNA-binding protein [Dactylosporangium sp. CA-139066]|uniref:ComEA family DNA-binding protein n=1 Tax=Dactylosporangium sp. CA-139066 TaxID=3239930 RepID=UPI003D8A683E